MAQNDLNRARRQFLVALAGAGSAILLTPDSICAADDDPRIAQIVATTIGIDMHNHVQIRFPKGPNDPKSDPHFELASQIKRSGFSAISQSFEIDAEYPSQKAGVYYQHFLRGMEFEDALLTGNHMRRALNMKDLQAAHDQRQPIVVQATEGAMFIEGRLGRVEEAYRRGVRNLQMVHEQDDMVSPLGDMRSHPAHLGGLTAFGAQVIKECNRLGMLVDLAHGTSEMMIAALKGSAQPLVISHAGLATAFAKRDVPEGVRRLLISDDVARAVASEGGIVGVWARLVDTMKDYVEAVKAMVDVAGIDHVGIGTDTNITASFILAYTNQIWPDEYGGFFYSFVAEMLRQGFTPNEVSKIGGGNFCRVFAKVTQGHN